MTQDTGFIGDISDQDDAASASLIVNRHHQVVDLHPSIDAIMAWPKADLIGHLLEELVHPGDLTALASLLSYSAAETTPHVILIRLQHAIEGWVWASLTETASDTSEQRQFTVTRQPEPETHPHRPRKPTLSWARTLRRLSARKVRSLSLIKPSITCGRVPGLRPPS